MTLSVATTYWLAGLGGILVGMALLAGWQAWYQNQIFYRLRCDTCVKSKVILRSDGFDYAIAKTLHFTKDHAKCSVGFRRDDQN